MLFLKLWDGIDILNSLLYYCILLKVQYLLSIHITSAALNTKSEFQVAVTPVEMG